MQIWQLGPERAAEWRDIRLEALLLAPSAFGARHADWAERPLADFVTRLTQARHFAAGPQPGAPLAVACWQAGTVEGDASCGWVMSVYARPAARGRGLMSALLQHIARDAAAQGMRSLGLYVVAANKSALRLYTRLGYRDTGDEGIVNGNGQPEIRMTLDLAANGQAADRPCPLA